MKRVILTIMVLSILASGAMAKPLSFTFSTSSTGMLNDSGTVYYPFAGNWGLNGATELRGFYDFDTSSLDGLSGFPIVSKVEFYYGHDMVAVQSPAPDSFDADFYIGEFMGNGLSAADWAAGDFAASKTWTTITSGWIDLGQEGINMMYEFGPDYIAFDPPEHFSLSIRHASDDDFLAATRRCMLRVTFAPSRTKAMEESSTFGSVKALYR